MLDELKTQLAEATRTYRVLSSTLSFLNKTQICGEEAEDLAHCRQLINSLLAQVEDAKANLASEIDKASTPEVV